MTEREAMKLALEALETLDCGDTYKTHNAASALRKALAQPEQEPVAWITRESKWRLTGGGNSIGTVPVHAKQSNIASIPLYTTPPHQPVSNTDELAQPEQEPVAYTNGTDVILAKHWTADYPPEGWEPLGYTTPPQRTWVGLTDEDLANCSGHEVRWALYWEKLLKERNT